MKDKSIDHDGGHSSVHTSREAAIGEVVDMLRKLENGLDPEGKLLDDEWAAAHHLVGAVINLKSIARSECHGHQVTHARAEREYIRGVEKMTIDTAFEPREEVKIRLMGVREPEIQALDDLPVSSIPSGLFDLQLSTEEAREIFILGVEPPQEIVIRLARLAYNARVLFNAVCEELGVDPDKLLDTAHEGIMERAEESGAVDLVEESNRGRTIWDEEEKQDGS